MPQFNPEFFPPQLFWLVVTFAALYFGLSKLVLPRVVDVLEARQNRIDDDLEKASALKREAEAVLAEYEKARAAAQAEALGLIREAQEAMAGEAAKQHEALSARLAEQVSEAEGRIDQAKDEAKAGIRDAAAEVVAAAAERLIGVKVEAKEAQSAVAASLSAD